MEQPPPPPPLATDVPLPPVGRVVRSGLVLSAAFAAANVLNALFHVSAARLLAPDEYSLLAALLAVVLVVGVPVGAIRAAVARDVAGALRTTGRALARALPLLGGAALVVGLPVALAINVRDPVPLLPTAAVLALTVGFAVAWGGLQGADRFGALSAAQIGYGALKLAFGALLGWAGAGVAGVMAGVALAAAATLALTALPLRRLWAAGRERRRVPAGRLLTRYTGGAGLALTLFAALTTTDLLLARVVLDGETAGAYAVTSLVARTLLIVPGVVTTVLFPRVATLDDRRRERRHLVAGLSAVGLAAGGATLVLALVPGPVVELAFGGEYSAGSAWLGGLALAMTLYALVNVQLFHFLSVGRAGYAALPAVALAGQALGFLLFHGSPEQLVAVQVATAGGLLLGGEALLRRR